MFQIDDLVICKSREENTAGNKDFNIYARVVFVSSERNVIALDRYLKHGQIPCGEKPLELPLKEVIATKFYEPMSDEEAQEFLEGLSKFNARSRRVLDTKSVVENKINILKEGNTRDEC